MRSFRTSFLLLWSILLCHGLRAQTTLTLSYCLETAVTNNLQVQQSSNQLEISEVSYLQQKFAFLPSVSAGVSMGKSFGTFVDNFTQQIAESPYTGSPNLGATLSLFQGMSKWNDLKNAKYSLESANYSFEDLKNDIRMNVALAFFQVIFSEDQMRIAEERLKVLEQQLEKAQAQMDAGVKTQGDVYGVKAQVATEKVNLVQQRNTYQRNLLNLIQSMNLDPSANYQVVRPDIEAMSEAAALPPLGDFYAEAIANNPGLRAKAMDALAKKYAFSSTKAIFYPSVSLSYGMGSFYSSNNRPILGVEPGPGGTFVPIYGDPKPLFQQMEENYGQNLSLGINIPIFSNYSLRRSLISSRISYENALLSQQSEENELLKSIQQAYLDVESARAQLDASNEQIGNVTEAYNYALAKHDAGMMDFYTLIEILNNKTKAEAGLIQARYDYVLKMKILELYQGKALTF